MIIVAGIARSGLTMTMQMLKAGGLPCAGEYPAFEPYDIGCIPWNQIGSQAVKLVDAQLQFPPKKIKAKVILLRRDLKQQARSTNKLNSLFGIPPVLESALVRSLRRDYAVIYKWARRQRAYVTNFEAIIDNPAVMAKSINNFLGCNLNVEAMSGAVINRPTECTAKVYELDMI